MKMIRTSGDDHKALLAGLKKDEDGMRVYRTQVVVRAKDGRYNYIIGTLTAELDGFLGRLSPQTLERLVEDLLIPTLCKDNVVPIQLQDRRLLACRGNEGKNDETGDPHYWLFSVESG